MMEWRVFQISIAVRWEPCYRQLNDEMLSVVELSQGRSTLDIHNDTVKTPDEVDNPGAPFTYMD